MAVIQLPPDPRYTGWDKALASFGIGLQGLGEQRRKKGLLELTLLQEFGGVIPVGEVSKTAKRLGLDEQTLTRIMEPVHAQVGSEQIGGAGLAAMNKPIVAYKMPSRQEQMLKAMRGSEMLKEELNRMFSMERIKREATRAEAVTRAEVTAREPERGARKEIAEIGAETAITTTGMGIKSAEEIAKKRIVSAEKIAGERIAAIKDVTEYKVEEARKAVIKAQEFEKEVLVLKEEYRQTMTPAQQAQIVLDSARATYLRAQADYLEAGGKDAEKRLADAYKRLGTLGMLDPETKTLKPFKTGSKELETAKAVFTAAGIVYEEVPGTVDRPWYKGDVPGVLLIPKGEQPYSVAPVNPDVDILTKSILSVDKTTLTLPNGQKLKIENGTVTYKGKKYKVE